MKSETQKKKEQALLMRVTGDSYAKIAKTLKVGEGTLIRWEKGWVDAVGIPHKGWNEELKRLQLQREQEELNHGFLLKKRRLLSLERTAGRIEVKINEQLPHITAKRASDIKALLSEFREILRQIAQEKGEWPSSGNQTLVAVKADISLSELQERYRNAKRSREEQPE